MNFVLMLDNSSISKDLDNSSNYLVHDLQAECGIRCCINPSRLKMFLPVSLKHTRANDLAGSLFTHATWLRMLSSSMAKLL